MYRWLLYGLLLTIAKAITISCLVVHPFIPSRSLAATPLVQVRATTMPRRKRQHSDTLSDSEGEYVPQNSTGRRSKPNIARKSSKRLATNAGDTDPLGPEDTPSSSKARPHSRTLHTISSSNDIRHALTAWYDGVRDTRGMPWRKQYDASLGLEERAQRAYEVFMMSDRTFRICANDCRSGYLRLCYSRHKLLRSSHITTVGCSGENMVHESVFSKDVDLI